MYGSTMWTMSSSPIPPGTSFSPSAAGLYTTSGSAPKTLGFEVIVSVAVIPTFASLTPLAAHIPSPSTALGISVWRSGFLGSFISRCDMTVLYFSFCSSAFTTTNFLGIKCPEPESSLRAIMVEPS